MKQNALEFLQYGTNVKDVLKEGFAPLIANVMKTTLSSRLKNTDGSGEAKSGSMVFTRMSNSTSNAYGTARTALKGEVLDFLKVTVYLDKDREIVNEAEAKDLKLYTIEQVLAKKQASNEKSMVRELERAFFQTAVDAGAKFTPVGTKVEDITEELILAVETTKNDFIDGVDRDMLANVLSPARYSELRKYIAEGIHNANINIGQEIIPLFNGAEVFSSIYLPTGVDILCMVKGSVAEPVWVSDFGTTKVPFSNAYTIELYYSYGVGAVMPDLIKYVGTYRPVSE